MSPNLEIDVCVFETWTPLQIVPGIITQRNGVRRFWMRTRYFCL